MDVEANYSRRLIDPSEIFSDRYKLMAAVAVIDVRGWRKNVRKSVFLSSALDLSLSSTRLEG